MLSAIWLSCKKPVPVNEKPIYESSFTGKWIMLNVTVPVPGDTLQFRTDSRSKLLRFNYSTQGPGSTALIYNYENEKFYYDDYVNPGAGFYHVSSFRWIIRGEQFRVRLNEIIRSISSDYYVTFRKLN
jgi:hypothetical protein